MHFFARPVVSHVTLYYHCISLGILIWEEYLRDSMETWKRFFNFGLLLLIYLCRREKGLLKLYRSLRPVVFFSCDTWTFILTPNYLALKLYGVTGLNFEDSFILLLKA